MLSSFLSRKLKSTPLKSKFIVSKVKRFCFILKFLSSTRPSHRHPDLQSPSHPLKGNFFHQRHGKVNQNQNYSKIYLTKFFPSKPLFGLRKLFRKFHSTYRWVWTHFCACALFMLELVKLWKLWKLWNFWVWWNSAVVDGVRVLKIRRESSESDESVKVKSIVENTTRTRRPVGEGQEQPSTLSLSLEDMNLSPVLAS